MLLRRLYSSTTNAASTAAFMNRTLNRVRRSGFNLLERKQQPAAAASSPSSSPLDVVNDDMRELHEALNASVLTRNTLLRMVARYYMRRPGKRLRPLCVLLVSHAYSANGSTSTSSTLRQRVLAQIVELIHTASLMHDDVIDAAHERRGAPSVNVEHGNKLAILAGDYLLARASVLLASLGHADVTRRMSEVIADLAEGEVMQMASATSAITMDEYLAKTYKKTASLLANASHCAVLLGDGDEQVASAAFAYGKHIGVAFQLVDDVLDVTSDARALGKDADGADLRQGLVTAPTLFAARASPALADILRRQFSRGADDAEHALRLVRASGGVDETRQLAASHAAAATRAVDAAFAPSVARDALHVVAAKVLSRES